MPKVEVWECGKTGLLFKSEHEWRRHLAAKARQNTLDERHRQLLAKSECIPEMRLCTTFDELGDWITNNADRLYVRAAIRGHVHVFNTKRNPKWLPPKGFTIRNVSFPRMAWKDLCSDRRCAPAGKKPNWSGSGSSQGYPGFVGSIRFEIGNHYTHSTDIFKETGIHTGGGGCGGDTSQYEITLFAEEWPLLVLHDQELYQKRDNWRFPPGVTGPSRIYEGGTIRRAS